jgi:hypothetical protein
LRAARPMLAGRPHEAAGNGSPRWMAAGPLHAGAQNPAYRPARPLPATLTCTVAVTR